ncbi:MAG: hypothetical protein HQL69_18765 [Magnetococcales bacterium]|nr:hypothetical protein [Magnetococcales bacterium]
MPIFAYSTRILEAYLSRNTISPDDLPEFMASVHRGLMDMKNSELEEVENRINARIDSALEEKKNVLTDYQQRLNALNEKRTQLRESEYGSRSERRDAILSIKEQIADVKESRKDALAMIDDSIKDFRRQLKDARNEIV